MVSDEKPDPCKNLACRIQKCLRNNNFDEAHCFDYIESMRRCCGAWKAQAATCDGFLKEMNKRDLSPTLNAELFAKNSHISSKER